MKSIVVPGTAAIIAAGSLLHSVRAQFAGIWAPDTWTITGAGVGGASAVFAPDGSSLTLTGGDGFGAWTIEATNQVWLTPAGGMMLFHWEYNGFNGTPGFDAGYYLHNGTAFLLSDAIGVPAASGWVTIPVQAGDIVGWRVTTVDGLFGPGQLKITEVAWPSPGALPLLGFAGLTQRRRR